MICKPITFAMSAPTADGSAAAVVCSKEFMESNQMQVCCDKVFFTQTSNKFPVGLCEGRDGCIFFGGEGWLGGEIMVRKDAWRFSVVETAHLSDFGLNRPLKPKLQKY